MSETVELKCVVCGKLIQVHPNIAKLMKKIGVATCGVECATKWINQQ